MELMEFVSCATKEQPTNNCCSFNKTINNEAEDSTNETTSFSKWKNKHRNSQVSVEPTAIPIDRIRSNDCTSNVTSSWSTEQKSFIYQPSAILLHNRTSECFDEKLNSIQKNYDNQNFLCPRCNKKMQEPRLLPCLHAMCSACVFDVIRKENNSKLQSNPTDFYAKCSICNFPLSVSKVPPPHYPLQHRLVMDAVRYKLVDRILCDACPHEVQVKYKASVQCSVCLRNFCVDCATKHEEQTNEKVKPYKHLMQPLWEVTRVRRTILCEIHPTNSLCYYCNACLQVCCKECIWSKEHRGHATETAIGAGKRAAAYLMTMLKKAKHLLNTLLTQYNNDAFANDIFSEQGYSINERYVNCIRFFYSS